MKTLFSMGFLGQADLPFQPGDAFETPERAPAPAPPDMAPSKLLTPKDISDLLAIIKAARADRARIAAWWDAHPNAKELLGNKLTDYSAALTDAMQFDELAQRLEWRLSQGGDVYIHDQEIVDLKNYQVATQKLVEIVEGKTKQTVPPAPVPPAIPGTPEAVFLPGGVALAAFMAAIFV